MDLKAQNWESPKPLRSTMTSAWRIGRPAATEAAGRTSARRDSMLTRTVRQCSWGVMCLWSRLWLIAPKLWMCIGRPSCTRWGKCGQFSRHHTRGKGGKGKGFTLSVCRVLKSVSGQSGVCVGYRRRVRVRRCGVPCGSPSASSQRSHPARGTAQTEKRNE